jgi:hypothetical protein
MRSEPAEIKVGDPLDNLTFPEPGRARFEVAFADGDQALVAAPIGNVDRAA